MRLHSTIKSNQELLRGISGMEEFASEGPEKLIDADDYLNPNNLDVLVEEDSSLTMEYDEAKLKSGKQPNSSQARVDVSYLYKINNLSKIVSVITVFRFIE